MSAPSSTGEEILHCARRLIVKGGYNGFSYSDIAKIVGIRNDPGPPYGNAWGHWRRDRRGVRLSDSDISGLVQVQIGARAARMRPYEMARARGQGRPVAFVVAEERGRPYHGGRRGNDEHEGRGRNKDHGPHRDHHGNHDNHD